MIQKKLFEVFMKIYVTPYLLSTLILLVLNLKYFLETLTNFNDFFIYLQSYVVQLVDICFFPIRIFTKFQRISATYPKRDNISPPMTSIKKLPICDRPRLTVVLSWDATTFVMVSQLLAFAIVSLTQFSIKPISLSVISLAFTSSM